MDKKMNKNVEQYIEMINENLSAQELKTKIELILECENGEKIKIFESTLGEMINKEYHEFFRFQELKNYYMEDRTIKLFC